MKKNLLLIAALGMATVASAANTRSMNDDYYWVNAGLDAPMDRGDRATEWVWLSSSAGEFQYDVDQANNALLVQDLTDINQYAFYAKPGDTVLVELGYNGAWMHSYCYIDYDNDGEFYTALNNDGTPADGSDVVSYNHYEGLNSLGEISDENQGSSCGVLPEFTIPSDITPGAYRIRFKVDWDCIDAGGNDDPGNLIANNGGVIIDGIIFIYGPTVTVSDEIKRGSVTNNDGEPVGTVDADQALTFLIVPDPEAEFGDITIKSGYNLDQEESENKFGNPQYFTTKISAEKLAGSNAVTIAASDMRGNIAVCGEMKSTAAVKAIEIDDATGETVIYNMNGQRIADPQPGIYIVNGQKRILK